MSLMTELLKVSECQKFWRISKLPAHFYCMGTVQTAVGWVMEISSEKRKVELALLWLSALAPIRYLPPSIAFHPWFVSIASIWTGPILPCFFKHFPIYCLRASVWCCYEDFAFVAYDFHTVSSSCFLQPFSELLQFFLAAFQGIHRPIICESQVAKWSFSDGRWAVKVFCIIFFRNILNSDGYNGHPCRNCIVWRKKLLHFRLVPLGWPLHRTTTWWLQSAGCRCCILLKFARGYHARHNQTLSWRCERAHSGVPNVSPPTPLIWICLFSDTPPWSGNRFFLFKDLPAAWPPLWW